MGQQNGTACGYARDQEKLRLTRPHRGGARQDLAGLAGLRVLEALGPTGKKNKKTLFDFSNQNKLNSNAL
jgi:hypothetical protein